MIRVLIVDDSPTVQQFLQHVLSADRAVEVVGIASNGEEAVEMARMKRPHVITMDISMPGMNGLEATRAIMESCPVPIVVVSASWDAGEVETSFRAMQAGAVAVAAKPRGGAQADRDPAVLELVQMVKLMAEVRVVRRRHVRNAPPIAREAASVGLEVSPFGIEIVAIGASTGGPVPIKAILSGLPRDFPAPLLVVQHIAPGFVSGMADWLAGTSRLPIHIASQGQPIEAGHVYIAPDNFHLGLVASDDAHRLRVALSRDAPEHGMRPSVSYLFRSVTKVCGGRAAGVLLSGMGRDGAEELRHMREAGATTFAQDEMSCAVYGMPGEAARLDAALHVLPPEKIMRALAELAGQADKRGGGLL